MSIGIGLELGPGAIRGVILERQTGRASTPSASARRSNPVNASAGVVLVAAHEIACDTAQPESLTQALIALRRTLRVTGPLVVGVPSASTIVATVSPLIPHLPRAEFGVQFELQQQLPVELTQFAWDYCWLPGMSPNGVSASGPTPQRPGTVGGRARRAIAVAAAMKRSLLEQRLACCRAAGLDVQSVSVTSLSLLNLLLTHPGAARPPVIALNVIDHPAMEWVAWGAEGPSVMSVPEAINGDALEGVLATWESFSTLVSGQPERLILVGRSADAPGLADQLSTKLGILVDWFEPARVVAGLSARVEQPHRLAAAMGLALQHLQPVPVRLNLVGQTQRARRGRVVRRVTLGVAAISAAAIGGFTLSAMVEIRQRHLTLARQLERQERLYADLRPQVRGVLQRQDMIQRRSNMFEQVLRDSPTVGLLLGQLAEALPDDVWITTLDVTRAASLGAVLEGRARTSQSLTTFLDRLRSVAGMTTVEPLSRTLMTDEATKAEVIVFSVHVDRRAAAALAATPPAQPPSATEPSRTTKTSKKRSRTAPAP